MNEENFGGGEGFTRMRGKGMFKNNPYLKDNPDAMAWAQAVRGNPELRNDPRIVSARQAWVGAAKNAFGSNPALRSNPRSFGSREGWGAAARQALDADPAVGNARNSWLEATRQVLGSITPEVMDKMWR